MYTKHLFKLFFFLLSWYALPAQQIWPGDVNNNGIVNAVDLLYWGQAHGTTGPARTETSAEWMAIPAPATWAESFPNGINYAFADCNGDGRVDEADFDEAIEGNYGLTHGSRSEDGFANAPIGSAAPALRLSTTTQVLGPGGTAQISLNIDDSLSPLPDFYGMALSLKYDTQYLNGDDGLDFDLNESSWLNRDGSYVEDVFEDDDNGAAMLAMTRTNQQPILVEPGEIGRFSIVIEDIVILRKIDTIHIEIDSVLLIGHNFEAIATQPTRIELIIAQDPSSVVISSQSESTARPDFPTAKLFPNPTRQQFFIESEVPIQQIEIFNAFGQRVDFQSGDTNNQRHRIQISPGQSSGLLWIRIWIDRQTIITRKLLYQSD